MVMVAVTWLLSSESGCFDFGLDSLCGEGTSLVVELAALDFGIPEEGFGGGHRALVGLLCLAHGVEFRVGLHRPDFGEDASTIAFGRHLDACITKAIGGPDGESRRERGRTRRR